jgi:hypothetical protein
MGTQHEALLANDPLLCSAPLTYIQEFYPYGFPVRIACNAREVLEAAEESWGPLRQQFNARPLEVRCLVSQGALWEVPSSPVVRAQGNLFVSVADAQNFLCGDLSKGFASAWVTQRVAAERDYFRYHFLEAVVYSLLDVFSLVSIHAACVEFRGHGVLLAGDSGAGKSSLAYACARRGWVYCSDDASCLVRREAGRTVVGDPRRFRFRETAGKLFPEFGGMRGKRRSNGKPTIEIATGALGTIRTTLQSHIDYIVFLNRHGAEDGRTRLVLTSKEEALRRLFWDPWPAELPAHKERRETVGRLAGAETCEMRYRDLDAAVDCLEQLIYGDSK